MFLVIHSVIFLIKSLSLSPYLRVLEMTFSIIRFGELFIIFRRDNICLLDVGTGVRKILFTISLSEARPEVIVIIDAVDKGRKPGEIFDISLDEIPKEKIDDFSIHQVPSSNLLKELQDLCSVKVRIMVCQTKTIPETIQSGLSKPVKKAVRLMAKKIAEEYF